MLRHPESTGSPSMLSNGNILRNRQYKGIWSIVSRSILNEISPQKKYQHL